MELKVKVALDVCLRRAKELDDIVEEQASFNVISEEE